MINDYKEALIVQKEQNSKLEDELRRLQQEFSLSAVPEISEIQQQYIEEEFDKSFKNKKKTSKSDIIKNEDKRREEIRSKSNSNENANGKKDNNGSNSTSRSSSASSAVIKIEDLM
jgi:predicted glycosyl hydrolase (DUF1957 family)